MLLYVHSIMCTVNVPCMLWASVGETVFLSYTLAHKSHSSQAHLHCVHACGVRGRLTGTCACRNDWGMLGCHFHSTACFISVS